MPSYRDRNFYYKDKTVSRPSYLCNGNPIPGKTVFLLTGPSLLPYKLSESMFGCRMSHTRHAIMYFVMHGSIHCKCFLNDLRITPYFKWYASLLAWAVIRWSLHAPCQWETPLHYNVVSHWLGANRKWSLRFSGVTLKSLDKSINWIHYEPSIW